MNEHTINHCKHFLELIESYSVRYSNLVFQHLHLTVPSHQQRWDYKWDTQHQTYWILFKPRDKDFVFRNTYRSTLQYINKSLLLNQNVLICRNWLKYFTITIIDSLRKFTISNSGKIFVASVFDLIFGLSENIFKPDFAAEGILEHAIIKALYCCSSVIR